MELEGRKAADKSAAAKKQQRTKQPRQKQPRPIGCEGQSSPRSHSTHIVGMSDCMVDIHRAIDEHLAQLEATVNTWPARQRSPPLATQTFKDSSFG